MNHNMSPSLDLMHSETAKKVSIQIIKLVFLGQCFLMSLIWGDCCVVYPDIAHHQDELKKLRVGPRDMTKSILMICIFGISTVECLDHRLQGRWGNLWNKFSLRHGDLPSKKRTWQLHSLHAYIIVHLHIGNPETNHAHDASKVQSHIILSHAQSMAGGFWNVENGLASRLDARN